MILQKSKSQITPRHIVDRALVLEKAESEAFGAEGRHDQGGLTGLAQRHSGNCFPYQQVNKSTSSGQGLALQQQRSVVHGQPDGARSTGGPKTPVNNHGKFFKGNSQVSFTNTSMNDQSVFSSSMDTEDNGIGGGHRPRFGGNKKKPRHHTNYGQI